MQNPDSVILGCPCVHSREPHCREARRGSCTCSLVSNARIIEKTRSYIQDKQYVTAMTTCTGILVNTELPLLIHMAMYGGPWESVQNIKATSDELLFFHMSISCSCNSGCGFLKHTNLQPYFWMPIVQKALTGVFAYRIQPLFERIVHLWRRSDTGYEVFRELLPPHFLCVCVRAAFFYMAQSDDILWTELMKKPEWRDCKMVAFEDMDYLIHKINTGGASTIEEPRYRPVKYSVRSSNRFHVSTSFGEAASAQLTLVDQNGPTAATVLLGFCSGCKVLKWRESSVGFIKSAWEPESGILWCTAPKCRMDIHFIPVLGKIIRYRDSTLGPCETCGMMTFYRHQSCDSRGRMACSNCLKTSGKRLPTKVCHCCGNTVRNGLTFTILDNDRPPALLMRRMTLCKKCEDTRDLSTTRTLRKRAQIIISSK